MVLTRDRAVAALTGCAELTPFRRGALKSFLGTLTDDKLRNLPIPDENDDGEIAGFLDDQLKQVERTGAGIGSSAIVFAIPVDDSWQHAEALFGPFEAADFPLQLHSDCLAQLLARAPAHLVPATLRDPSIWPSSLGPLFVPHACPQPDGRLAARLLHALDAAWPLGNASELLYTPYWSDIGFTLPEFVGTMLQQQIVIHRNVQDDTITTKGSKRDFFITLDGLLLVGGEDKSSASQLKNAVIECQEKHKGANAALYGQLGYILLTVVAEDRFSVYGMRLDPNFSMECIVRPFSIKGRQGQARALLTFINITRWIRTVAELRLLPPRSTLPMFQRVTRPSPFQGECPASQHTSIEMRLRSVEKEFFIPSSRLQNLLDVYGLLSIRCIPGTIVCTQLEVDGQVVPLQHPMHQTRSCADGRQAVQVKLVLRPVAAAWELLDNAALRGLCANVLDTLRALHESGFVHRDVRDANVLRDSSRFLLIDWELAAPIDAPVFWQAAEGGLPPGVHTGTPWQPWMDLWQLGQMMRVQRAVASLASDAFIAKLQGRQFSSADEALGSLW